MERLFSINKCNTAECRAVAELSSRAFGASGSLAGPRASSVAGQEGRLDRGKACVAGVVLGLEDSVGMIDP